MNAFLRFFLTIVSVLFFGCVALSVSSLGGSVIGALEIESCLQCGMLATILIYLVYDRIDKDIEKEKNKNKDNNKDKDNNKE